MVNAMHVFCLGGFFLVYQIQWGRKTVSKSMVSQIEVLHLNSNSLTTDCRIRNAVERNTKEFLTQCSNLQHIQYSTLLCVWLLRIPAKCVQNAQSHSLFLYSSFPVQWKSIFPFEKKSLHKEKEFSLNWGIWFPFTGNEGNWNRSLRLLNFTRIVRASVCICVWNEDNVTSNLWERFRYNNNKWMSISYIVVHSSWMTHVWCSIFSFNREKNLYREVVCRISVSFFFLPFAHLFEV